MKGKTQYEECNKNETKYMYRGRTPENLEFIQPWTAAESKQSEVESRAQPSNLGKSIFIL